MEFCKTYIIDPIRTFGWADVVDILLLTAILYFIYSFVKVRRAGRLAFGLALVLILYAVSDLADLHATNRLLAGIAPFGIIIIAIIFQPELRDGLEKLSSTVFDLRRSAVKTHASLTQTVSEVVEAACQIALTEEDGALIVIERGTQLGDYAAKGVPMDAEVNNQILRNIFINRSPLHDGAVIIRSNRIAAAGCKLPLTTNEDAVRGLGTRHRAAVGLTEVSDCVVVVVSEERHIISVGNSGMLKRDYNRGVSDLRNEESLKNIQNRLRKDLFLLLAGRPFDEAEAARTTSAQPAAAPEEAKEPVPAPGRRKFRLGVMPGRRRPSADGAAAPGEAPDAVSVPSAPEADPETGDTARAQADEEEVPGNGTV